ncbi:MAG: cyclic nucleotide-binding domain-containing protein [Actinomycetota bacterium]
MQTIDEVLEEIPFFGGLKHEDLELIAGCGSNVHFEDGETLFREGGPADTFLLIRHGSVSLSCYAPPKGSVILDTVGPGDILGWSWLFPPHRWHFDAKAVGVVRATQFDAVCLRTKIEQDPRFGYELMRRFTQVLLQRLQWTRMRLIDMYADHT